MSSRTGRTAAPRRPTDTPTADFDFLSGGGDMGARMRALDWTSTPLGPPQQWPQSLKTIVRVMLDSRYAMWMLWGPELTFFCNDAYLPTLGIKRDWALGARSDKVWEEIWPDIGPRIAQVLENGRATWDEALLLTLERGEFPEETYHTFSYSPVYDDESQIAGMLCVVTEVTERVIGERRLRVLRELAARAVGATSIEESCRGACEVLGEYPFSIPFAAIYLFDSSSGAPRRMARTPGLPAHVLPPTLDVSNGTWPVAELLATETAQHVANLAAIGVDIPAGPWPEPARDAFLLPLKGAGGERLAGFLVAAASPRRVLDEAYRNFFGLVAGQIAAAIADAQASEAERRRAEALAEIDRAKTIFFSNISHEFRTPLTLILGPLEEAATDPAAPAPMRRQLELAHRNALRLGKLVNNLLDYSRIEAGRAQASYEPTDLAALTRDIASTFRSAIERAGLEFRVDCAHLDEPVHVDREMWEKIVLNLLSNAFKFTLEGRIAVRLSRESNTAILEVSDTGVGIPDHEIPRLFERFYRVEGTAGRTQEGSGIGLALVQELVKLHGGTIAASSQVGTGTTFRVAMPFGIAHLPRERIQTTRSHVSTHISAQAFVQEALRWVPSGAEKESAPARLATPAEETPPAVDRRLLRTAGSRVLLADDNADMRSYVRDLLSPTYLVEVAADGEEALRCARRERPDLILSDIMMPRIDGLALLKALRADEKLRDVPVILLSARAGEEARVGGLDAGADDYLVKPFSARELLARVGALLELTQMRRENEERFRAFVSATSDVIYRMSADWTEMRHLEGRNVIADTSDPSRTWLDEYIHPDDQPRVRAAIREAIRTKQIFQLEHRVRRVDGTLGWTFSRAIPLKNKNGDILEWFGAATDITERKQAEQSLREREEALRQANAKLSARTLELARFNQVAVGRELRLIELKGEVNRLSEQLGQKPPYPLEFDRAPSPPQLQKEAETEALAPLDTILRTEELQNRPRRPPDHEAETRAMMALVQALADSPRTILQALADKTLEVLNAGSAGLSLLTREGDRFYWAAIAGGWSPHLGGGTPREFGPCGDVLDRNTPLLFTRWERRYPYLAEATPLAEEGLLVPFHVDGRAVGTIWVIAHDSERKFDLEDLRLLQMLSRFASAAYQAVEFLGALDQRRAALNLLEDAVQARQHAEESNRKLRESEEALLEADRRKTEFLALLGHELRNPLSPISTASELLSRTLSGDASAQTPVEMIKRQTAHLTRLVDDLLDVGRITQGRIELKRSSVDLASVISQAIETVEPLFRQKQHRVSIVSSYEPLYVNGDCARLVQCVVNILTNAAKYTDEGGEIRVATRAEGSTAVMEIADSGVGIAPAFLPRLFDLFVQGDRTLDRAQGGLGIGLSVVKRLIEMHEGEVRAQSAGLGQGSTFTIQLPRIPRPEPVVRIESVQAPPRRVLIVDDNEDAANSLAMLLSHAGHDVQVAYSGREALALVESFQPEVALLDIGLPEMDGYELATRLQAIPRLNATRLIALTGYGQSEDRQRSRAVGFSDHLVKPVDLPALERALAGIALNGRDPTRTRCGGP